MHRFEDTKASDSTEQSAVSQNDASETLLNSTFSNPTIGDWQKQPYTAQELPKLQLLSGEANRTAGLGQDQTSGSDSADQEDNVGRHGRGHGGFYPNPYGPPRNPPTSILRANQITVRDGVISSGEVTRRTRM